MDYIWYPAYRSAMLETDKLRMRARLSFAEREMVARLRVIAQDHGGTPEERNALAHALTGIKNLRAEVNGWDSQSDNVA